MPEWVKDAVFYQIFPDRFARSGALHKTLNLESWEAPPSPLGFKGGDLLGIVERLDYLQDLGVNAIYLNPVFQSAANHRYHTHDYYQVDPLLGGNAALRTLLDESHRRGIRVVLDGVFNHCGRGLFQFHHILENGASSPFLDWFTIKGFPLNAYSQGQEPNYEAWWGMPGLPKFNTANPTVREFLWAVARHWVQLGIDGWRLDVPEEIADPAFWQEFRRQVKSANPEAYLLGEIWHQAPEWLQGDRFDGVMNYPLTTACLRFLVEDDLDPKLVRGMSYAQGGHLSASGFADAVNQVLAAYQPEVSQNLLNPLDSHDTARFLTLARGDESALRLAVLFQMTYPGAPCVYYGDEIGMEGGRDPDCRRAFPWEESRWNSELRAHFKRCISLRHAHPSLRRGEFALLHAEGDVFSFARRLGNETLIVALNASRLTQAPTVRLGGYLPEGTRLHDVWTGATITVSDGRLVGVKMAPRSGSVWAAEPPHQQPDASRH